MRVRRRSQSGSWAQSDHQVSTEKPVSTELSMWRDATPGVTPAHNRAGNQVFVGGGGRTRHDTSGATLPRPKKVVSYTLTLIRTRVLLTTSIVLTQKLWNLLSKQYCILNFEFNVRESSHFVFFEPFFTSRMWCFFRLPLTHTLPRAMEGAGGGGGRREERKGSSLLYPIPLYQSRVLICSIVIRSKTKIFCS